MPTHLKHRFEMDGAPIDESVLRMLFAGPQKPFDPCLRGSFSQDDQPGVMGSIAAMMLMTILYAARVARFVLFKPIDFLAKRITRWDNQCDCALHWLMLFFFTQSFPKNHFFSIFDKMCKNPKII